MAENVAARADVSPRKTLDAARPRGGALNSVEDVGAVVVAALDRSDISQKEAALTMGLADAQFTRQLQGKEHLSLRRLWLLPNRFWRELLMLVAERRQVARVSHRIVF